MSARPTKAEIEARIEAEVERRRMKLPEDLRERIQAMALAAGEYPNATTEMLIRLGLLESARLQYKHELDLWNQWVAHVKEGAPES